MILEQLGQVLSDDQILRGSAVKERSHHIWQLDKPLIAKAVLLPKSTKDVSEIMKLCHAHDQRVIVHGGLTNLVGSTETSADEIVISLEKMNHIEEVDPASRAMTVQSGVILEKILDKATEQNLLFPLNFGAKGSAQIGGAISTNAGGLRVFRYGMTRNLVLGLEVVLPDGTIISSMKKIIKDNSGYDLKQYFIGAEGTLGIITRAVLKLVEAPKSRNTAFVGINKYDDVIALLKHMDSGLAGTLSGFELIWPAFYEGAIVPNTGIKPPIPSDFKYYVLVESLGSDQQSDQDKMTALLESALESGIIADAAIAQSQSDLEWFWTIREDVHAVVSQCSFDQHFDISVPIPLVGDLIDDMITKLLLIDGVEHVFPFGHVADGNIHLVVGKHNESESLKNQINDIVYSPLKAIGGSVSAEHGIGVHKKAYLHLCRTDAEIELMKMIKRSFDPKGILNMGKVIG